MVCHLMQILHIAAKLPNGLFGAVLWNGDKVATATNINTSSTGVLNRQFISNSHSHELSHDGISVNHFQQWDVVRLILSSGMP